MWVRPRTNPDYRAGPEVARLLSLDGFRHLTVGHFAMEPPLADKPIDVWLIEAWEGMRGHPGNGEPLAVCVNEADAQALFVWLMESLESGKRFIDLTKNPPGRQATVGPAPRR